MQTLHGDIWRLATHPILSHIVVPTNIGWRKDGQNPMGVGLARQAAVRFPELSSWYGEQCARLREHTPVMARRCAGLDGGRNLILFPVKPLRVEAPHLSWQGPASVELIKASLLQLKSLIEAIRLDLAKQERTPGWSEKLRVFIPPVGCGFGGLKHSQVFPLVAASFAEDPAVRLVLPRGAGL